ncbi:MAG TPA: hypothetical protein VM219_07665 [Phycisphaerae bacterium]|nr:hypothetical protein [Phycisphaerae bacterium]
MLVRHIQNIAQGLVLIALVLALIAAALWIRPLAIEPKAQARAETPNVGARGIPDAGLQREMIIKELRAMNQRLASIEAGLTEGRFHVQTSEAEEGAEQKKGAAP